MKPSKGIIKRLTVTRSRGRLPPRKSPSNGTFTHHSIVSGCYFRSRGKSTSIRTVRGRRLSQTFRELITPPPKPTLSTTPTLVDTLTLSKARSLQDQPSTQPNHQSRALNTTISQNAAHQARRCRLRRPDCLHRRPPNPMPNRKFAISEVLESYPGQSFASTRLNSANN